MTAKILLLLFIFQIKHFVADFPLQNKYMLGKFKEKGWILPLTAHSGVHAVFTFIISLCFVGLYVSILLGVMDFVIHFTMDRIKASPKMLGRFKAINEFEYASYQKRIDRSFKEGAIYDVSEAETDLHYRMESNKKFWWSLGLDQMVHHLTHYIIIMFLI